MSEEVINKLQKEVNILKHYWESKPNASKWLEKCIKMESELAIAKAFDVNDYQFERCSGYSGYRNVYTGEWIMKKDYDILKNKKN